MKVTGSSPDQILEHISEGIVGLYIPDAIPLGYRLDDYLQVIDRYLVEMPY